MDLEMLWLFDAKDRPLWHTVTDKKPDWYVPLNKEEEGFFKVEDLKLDDFIRRKYEDLLRQIENMKYEKEKIYKDNYKNMTKKWSLSNNEIIKLF